MPAFLVVALFVLAAFWEHLIVNNDVHYIIYHDVAVVTFCKILFGVSCASLVLHRSSGEPRPTSFGFGASSLPPPAPLCSEALPVALQGRDWQKCDLRHVGRHAGRGRVTPAADRPPGAYWKQSAQVIGPRE